MLNKIRNLNIRQQLQLLLVSLLGGFALIALAYLGVLQLNSSTQSEVQSVTELRDHVQEMLLQATEARRQEKNFLLRKDSGAADLQFKAMDAARKAAAAALALEAELGEDDADTKAFRKVDALFATYESRFKTAVADQKTMGLTENDGLQGSFRNAVHDVEELVQSANSLPLEVSMLQMRRHEKDFLVRRNDKYVKSMADEHTHFQALLASSGLSAQAKADVAKKMEIYQQGFAEVVARTHVLMKDEADFQSIYRQAEPILKTLTASLQEEAVSLNHAALVKRNILTSVFFVMLVLFGAGASWLVFHLRKNMQNSLEQLQGAVEKVAKGNFDARAKLATHDELGALGNAFDRLLDDRFAALVKAEKENDQLNDSVIDLMEATSKLSDRDLTVRVTVKEDVTGPVADALNMMTTQTANTLLDIRNVAEQVQNAAATVKQQGDKVGVVAANEQKALINTLAKLDAAVLATNQIAELSKMSNLTASQASESTEKALATVTDAVAGMNEIRDTIRETEKRIKRLGERSQEISGIVSIINSIAERTSVLALNASMQAAAAGDAGRGFAVVAEEVQRLAESSRNSTSQIGTLVNNIQTETAETMATMNKTIGQVVEGSDRTELAGKQMKETRLTTQALVKSVEQISNSAMAQAQVTSELREQAALIQQGANETNNELMEQTVHTNSLVDSAARLLTSVRAFKLPA